MAVPENIDRGQSKSQGICAMEFNIEGIAWIKQLVYRTTVTTITAALTSTNLNSG